MKTLLLLLGVVLVCDGHIPLVDDLAQLSGAWNTLYVSSSNFDKISDNGPFHGFMRTIDVDIPHGKVFFTFFLKGNGFCKERHLEATIGGDKLINIDYEGQNDFRILHLTPNAMIGYNVNVDSTGRTTKMVALFGRGNHADNKDVAKFMELTREKNIPEENIINVSEIEKCPQTEDEHYANMS